MAIRVICPGCMTSFEVDDRFAGKKGPCPKCGHIIEIPKEQVVIHAPDDITDGKKTRKNMAGHDARPILQERFTFSLNQILLGVLGVLVMFLLSWLVGLAHNGWVSLIVGLVFAFVVAWPTANFGYMLLRDPNELDKTMFEYPHERHMRALYAALVFTGSWAIFEAFVHYLGGSGLVACLYLIPIALIGSFGAVIFFDLNFGSAILIYLMFMFAAIIGRGLIISDGMTPVGWIWNGNHRVVAAAPKAPKPKPRDEKIGSEEAPQGVASEETPKEPEVKKFTREAPKVDPNRDGRRR